MTETFQPYLFIKKGTKQTTPEIEIIGLRIFTD